MSLIFTVIVRRNDAASDELVRLFEMRSISFRAVDVNQFVLMYPTVSAAASQASLPLVLLGGPYPHEQVASDVKSVNHTTTTATLEIACCYRQLAGGEITFPIPKVDGARISYGALYELLHGPRGVTLRRGGFFSPFKTTFVACDLVAALLLRLCGRGATVSDALPLCRALHEHHMITTVERVSATTPPVFDWNRAFWRFTADHGTQSLNSDRVYDSAQFSNNANHCVPRNAAIVAQELREWIDAVVKANLDASGAVDFGAVSQHDSFRCFSIATTELQIVDLGDLSRAERISCGINLYNTGVIHAYAVRGVPRTRREAERLISVAGYNIGGQYFTLRDIRDGVLRSNRRSPGAWSPPFARRDPRLATIVWNPDYRALMALSHQLKEDCDDGPPRTVYPPGNLLDAQLQAAANAYVARSTTLHGEGRILRVSSLFWDFNADFDLGVAATCVKHLAPSLAAECVALGISSLRIEFKPNRFSVNVTSPS